MEDSKLDIISMVETRLSKDVRLNADFPEIYDIKEREYTEEGV